MLSCSLGTIMIERQKPVTVTDVYRLFFFFFSSPTVSRQATHAPAPHSSSPASSLAWSRSVKCRSRIFPLGQRAMARVLLTFRQLSEYDDIAVDVLCDAVQELEIYKVRYIDCCGAVAGLTLWAGQRALPRQEGRRPAHHCCCA